MTKRINMNGKNAKGRFVFVSDERYDDLAKYSWYVKEDPERNTWYAVTNMDRPDGKRGKVKMHRYIVGVYDPSVKIDHINGRGWDNQDENLRVATTYENNLNRPGSKHSASQYKGVSRHNKAWRARIKINGKEVHLGDFQTDRDGGLAYDHAARKHYGKFAWLNFPDIILTDDEFFALTKKGKCSSKYLGVTWDKSRNKWSASITIDYKKMHIGRFDHETTASVARDIVLFKHYGSLPNNTKFNHPDLFNSDTLTWDAINADPTLRELYHRVG